MGAASDISVGGLGRAELIGLLDRSLEVELRELARASPSAVFRELPDAAWCVGAVPGATVYRTRLTAAEAPARVAELSDALQMFGPVTWWAGPTATPDNLSDLLGGAGYRLEDDEAGMAVGLDRLVEDLPRPEALEVVEVERSDGILDPRFLEGWLEVNRETLAWPAEKVARRRGLYEDDDRRPRPWRHFVGLLDRRPVSASRVLIADDVAMVHGVSTVPDARRRGIGSAVTVAALVAAREAGCRIGVLQASSMGQGPYRRLGFQYVAPYGRYVRDAATPFDRDESAGGASEDAESAAA